MKLGDTRDVWLDAGIMPSHIGVESAIGADNWTLTRSLAAENSPYYIAGARLGWSSADGKWSAAGLLLNGWQRIAFGLRDGLFLGNTADLDSPGSPDRELEHIRRLRTAGQVADLQQPLRPGAAR